MCGENSEDKPPLKEEDIRWLEIMADTRFDCDFWASSPGMRRVIKRLLLHIRYQEETIGKLKEGE